MPSVQFPSPRARHDTSDHEKTNASRPEPCNDGTALLAVASRDPRPASTDAENNTYINNAGCDDGAAHSADTSTAREDGMASSAAASSDPHHASNAVEKKHI